MWYYYLYIYNIHFGLWSLCLYLVWCRIYTVLQYYECINEKSSLSKFYPLRSLWLVQMAGTQRWGMVPRLWRTWWYTTLVLAVSSGDSCFQNFPTQFRLVKLIKSAQLSGAISISPCVSTPMEWCRLWQQLCCCANNFAVAKSSFHKHLQILPTFANYFSPYRVSLNWKPFVFSKWTPLVFLCELLQLSFLWYIQMTLKPAWLLPGKSTAGTQKLRFGGWFSFSIG